MMLQVRVRTLKMPEREEDRAIPPIAVLVRTTDSLRDLRAVLVAHAAAPVEPESDSDEEDHDDTAACKAREVAREAARAAAVPDPQLTWVAGNNFEFVVNDVKVKRKQVISLDCRRVQRRETLSSSSPRCPRSAPRAPTSVTGRWAAGN